MKTKTFGSTVYIVKKYYTDANGNLQCIWTSWSKKKYAFEDYRRWTKEWGEDEATIFKAKQCMEM